MQLLSDVAGPRIDLRGSGFYTRRRLGANHFGAAMNVVAGHSRKVGKTAVVAGLMRGTKSIPWTAVKISQHACQVPARRDPRAKSRALQAFTLIVERDPLRQGDNSRHLAAGARRAFWLRVRRGHLAPALPTLLRTLGTDEFVVMESSCILSFLKPTAYVVVLDRFKQDFKSSAGEFLARADALVTVESTLESRAWPTVDPREFRNKPVFTVSRRYYFSLELCRFIGKRLQLSDFDPPGEGRPRSERKKEQLWLH